jgi:hypothetical protein
MFRTVPLSIISSFSLYTQQCSVLILLASCQQTCMTYIIALCAVLDSWWWTETQSETCRILFQKSIWEISACSWFYYMYIKKVKWSRYRPGVAQRVGRVIALLFHYRGTRRWWVVSSTPRPHFTPGKDPVPILQETLWATGLVWTGGKSRPHRDSIPDRPARSSVAIPTELPGPHSCPIHY